MPTVENYSGSWRLSERTITRSLNRNKKKSSKAKESEVSNNKEESKNQKENLSSGVENKK